ncbi:MAG TPA: histidine phosphatase family protein [Acidimicrobiales bacterium]|nr:histidine phosphatase family protein [Acidimicrobiales bacterium]
MLILARHGRTAANAQRLLLGRADVGLDEHGVEQAAAIGAALVAAAPSRIVSSPLERCVRTAAAVAEATGAPVTTDARWIEVDYGQFDRTPLSDVPHEVWQHWRTDPGWRPPGGESLREVGARVSDACAELTDEVSEGTVVVVTHVSPIKAAVAWALGTGDDVAWRLFCDVASLSRIRVGPTGPTLVTFNETSHL